MDLLLLLKAAILGIVEGLTEFLPISSTGHLILAGALLKFDGDKAKLFEIVIQSAAILAVAWEYRQRLCHAVLSAPREAASRRLIVNVAVAFVPLAVLGLIFGKFLKAHLFNAPVVATTFILGGLIILWVERKERPARVSRTDDMTWQDGLKVGIAQAFALIPGTSRSGSTIIGGMLFGLSRTVATEFTFFLAIPTLVIASLYELYKGRALLSVSDSGMWAVGMVASFVSAFIVVRWLIRFVSTHKFTVFAWYRIAFGLIILLTWQLGWVQWVDG